jgi:hypothetical protein
MHSRSHFSRELSRFVGTITKCVDVVKRSAALIQAGQRRRGGGRWDKAELAWMRSSQILRERWI